MELFYLHKLITLTIYTTRKILQIAVPHIIKFYLSQLPNFGIIFGFANYEMYLVTYDILDKSISRQAHTIVSAIFFF